jgi:hypothetical protein
MGGLQRNENLWPNALLVSGMSRCCANRLRDLRYAGFANAVACNRNSTSGDSLLLLLIELAATQETNSMDHVREVLVFVRAVLDLLIVIIDLLKR